MSKICIAVVFGMLHISLSAQTTSPVEKTSEGVKIFGVVMEKVTGNEKTDLRLPGVSVRVKGEIAGTITDEEGRFTVVASGLPTTLIFSRVGLKTVEIQVNVQVAIEVGMEEESILGQEIVVSATRIEDKLISSPVTIEKLNERAIQQSPSDDYYKAIANLKGVDIVQSSVNSTTLNARGFMSTVNTRVVQYQDGVDTQLPSLNYSASNLIGPTTLDIESIEFLPGTSSALYGPNAFNGVISQRTKSPFDYQGISTQVKFGINHVHEQSVFDEKSGKDLSGAPKPMYEVSLRYAKAFKRFAFKLSGGYSEGTNWYGVQPLDRNASLRPEGYSFNPAADEIFLSGDEVSTSLGLLKPQLAQALANTPLEGFVQFLPSQTVARTGYSESSLMDYDTYSAKITAALHYRLKEDVELSYIFNYGEASTIINAAQRTPIDGFSLTHHNIQLKSKDFLFRTYVALPDAGHAYSGDLTGVLINNKWKPHGTWFGDYAVAYLTSLAQQSTQPGFDPNSVATQQAAHVAGRNAADAGRFMPGTAEFEAAKKEVTTAVIPRGSRIKDNTRMYHADTQYDFSSLTKIVSVQVGANFRMFDLNSDGTLFADSVGNDIVVKEYGAFVQAAKPFMNDRIRLTASVRYDKNENFDAQFNPRVSVVFSPLESHYLRIGYQTGFRNPTLQGQHVDFNAVSLRILGGLPQYAAAHNAYENSFLLSSVQQYTSAVAKAGTATAAGDPLNLALLVPVSKFEPVKPEQVKSAEIGYRMIVAENIMVDVSFYHNRYKNFIAQRAIRKANGPIDQEATTITPENIGAGSSLLFARTTPGDENTFSIYTNVAEEISSQGISAGVEYSLPKNYRLLANYNWNRLNEQLGEGFISEFNTPEHKFNIGFGNEKVINRVGFNITYRWQQGYLFESTFAKGNVPAFGTTDVQVSYSVPSLNSVVKLGGANVFNQRYFTHYGGPTLGGIYYVSVTLNALKP